MTDSNLPDPTEFGPSGSALWESVTRDYDLETHEQIQLAHACRLTDRLDRINAELDVADTVFVNRHGEISAHPLLNEARQTTLALGRILATLRIPTGDEDAQPQRRGGARGFYQRAGRR